MKHQRIAAGVQTFSTYVKNGIEPAPASGRLPEAGCMNGEAYGHDFSRTEPRTPADSRGLPADLGASPDNPERESGALLGP
jgi:hypothetical protein